METFKDSLNILSGIVGEENIFTDDVTLKDYGHDETEDLSFPPMCVLKPNTVSQISQIVQYCFHQSIPITPIGARTGLSGGALSVQGGVGLSLERMNKIIDIDEQNLQVTVEPGVITEELQNAVEAKGLYYPPDPSSKGSCFIGGNIAENAGGARAVKYGVTKDFVLNLEVVLPNGNVIRTGANTLKNSTGYNLTQLFVGSEGTLGIITKAVLKLVPLPSQNILLLASFVSAAKACETVSAIFRAGITPSALEFMERDAVLIGKEYANDQVWNIADDTQAQLLIELDGNDMDYIMKEAEKVSEVLEQYGCNDILFADTHEQKEMFWKVRRCMGRAVKSSSIYKEEDTVVPRFQLANLLNKVKEIGKKYGFDSVCYGHAGDGNLHVNILKGKMNDESWNHQLPLGIKEIFEYTVSLKGTLSGEHGIGYVQRKYMPIAFDENQMGLMRGIKNLIDTKGIMNPGKVL